MRTSRKRRNDNPGNTRRDDASAASDAHDACETDAMGTHTKSNDASDASDVKEASERRDAARRGIQQITWVHGE